MKGTMDDFINWFEQSSNVQNLSRIFNDYYNDDRYDSGDEIEFNAKSYMYKPRHMHIWTFLKHLYLLTVHYKEKADYNEEQLEEQKSLAADKLVDASLSADLKDPLVNEVFNWANSTCMLFVVCCFMYSLYIIILLYIDLEKTIDSIRFRYLWTNILKKNVDDIKYPKKIKWEKRTWINELQWRYDLNELLSGALIKDLPKRINYDDPRELFDQSILDDIENIKCMLLIVHCLLFIVHCLLFIVHLQHY